MLIYGRIYLLTNLVNGKRYVGQTTYSLRVRLQRHFNVAYHPGKRDFYLCRALRKYGKENFEISLLCSCGNKAELDLMEDLYIAIYGTMNSSIGYNRKRGGANGKQSLATRLLSSQVRKGKKHSIESRIKRSIAFSGSRNPMFGRKASLDTREKMSQNRRGDKSYKYRKDVNTDDLILLYPYHSTTELGKMFKIDPSTVGDRLKKAGVQLRSPSKHMVRDHKATRLQFQPGPSKDCSYP